MIKSIACAILAASSLAGCIIVAEPAGTVTVYGHHEPHGHAFIYLPGYHAYYCTEHDDWWCIDGGRWTYYSTRPSHVHVDVNVAWVHVDGDGPEPYRAYDHHSREYPPDWRPGRRAGPPPGRAWGFHAGQDGDPGDRGHDDDDRGRDRDGDESRARRPDSDADAPNKHQREQPRGEQEEQERAAEKGGGAAGKEGSPPKDKPKDKSKDKSRGRDKDKNREKGGEGDEARKKDGGSDGEKDVEKEKDPPEKKEEDGNNDDERERKREKKRKE